jgi:hypothetical protein
LQAIEKSVAAARCCGGLLGTPHRLDQLGQFARQRRRARNARCGKRLKRSEHLRIGGELFSHRKLGRERIAAFDRALQR